MSIKHKKHNPLSFTNKIMTRFTITDTWLVVFAEQMNKYHFYEFLFKRYCFCLKFIHLYTKIAMNIVIPENEIFLATNNVNCLTESRD